MTNTEWAPHPEDYDNEEYEEYDDEEYEGETTDEEVMEVEDFLSTYEEMFADLPIRSASIVADTMKLTLSPPIFNITDGVSITFNHSDKATITQEVTDGQLSITVQENDALESIKICVNNRTWVIPLDTFPLLPPSMPKKR